MQGLIVRSQKPFNAEPPLDRLRASFITPRDDFYVRSHGPVPALQAEGFQLIIDGLVARPLTLTLADLREQFQARTVNAVMQCAGNRREELHALRAVSGDPWAAGAIGNAAWTGAMLADVLQTAGARTDAGLHVVFTSADHIDVAGKSNVGYGASIPMAKACCPEVLLAYAMNGEPLTAEHGFPLRALVPGYAGVRSAKWLTRISVSDEPSESPIQRHDYKLFPPHTTNETADWDAGVTINELPLTSAICVPVRNASVPAGPVIIRGYAYASGRDVVRVDVSRDGGQRWQQAMISRPDDSPWSWTFWEVTFELDPGEHELTVRAWDSAGQTQPDTPADVWNFKGYLCSCWHRVRVRAT